MEKNKHNKWVNEVIGSADKIQRVKPRSDLFAKIESQIDSTNFKQIPIQRFRLSAAAAVLLLVLNGIAISSYYTNSQSDELSQEMDFTSAETLLTDYNLYP